MQSFGIHALLFVAGVSSLITIQGVDVVAQVDSKGAAQARVQEFVRREVVSSAQEPEDVPAHSHPIDDANKQLTDGGTVIVNERGMLGAPGHQLQSTGATKSVFKRTSTPATILYWTVILVMLCINLAISENSNIKQTTCKVMSSMISLIAALLVYNVIKDWTNLFLGDQAATSVSVISTTNPQGTGSGGPPTTGEIWMSTGRFLFFFLLLKIGFWKMRTRTQWLKSHGVVVGHIVAFLGADAVATTQEAGPWNESLGYSFAWILMSTFILLALVGIFTAVRTKMSAPSPAPEEGASQEASQEGASQEEGDTQDLAWMQYAEQSEDELLAVALGLLWAQWFRFAITEKMTHFRGVQVQTDIEHIWAMYGCGAVAALLAFALAFCLGRMEEPSARVKRAFSIKIKGLAMTSAWCFLYFAKWYYQYLLVEKEWFTGGDTITAQMYMVLNLVFWAFAGSCLLSMLARKNAMWKPARDNLSEAVLLLAALGWETLITTVTKAEVLTYTDLENGAKTFNACCNYLFVGSILLFTWIRFFLPMAQSVGDDWVVLAATDGDKPQEDSKDAEGTAPQADAPKAKDKQPVAAPQADAPKADGEKDQKDEEF